MMHEVDRDVVSDLWPLYRAKEASRASRALVETFLAEDSAFAATLQRSEELGPRLAGLRLSPDAEARLLADARQRARTKMLVIGGGIALAGFVALVALAGVLFLTFRS